MADTDALTPKQRATIAELMTARDLQAAADAAGVGRRTIYRWLELPHFAAALQDAQNELIDGATRRLAAILGNAAATMEEIMQNSHNPPGVRLRAAESIITNHLRLREWRDLADRVAALEEALGKAAE